MGDPLLDLDRLFRGDPEPALRDLCLGDPDLDLDLEPDGERDTEPGERDRDLERDDPDPDFDLDLERSLPLCDMTRRRFLRVSPRASGVPPSDPLKQPKTT